MSEMSFGAKMALLVMAALALGCSANTNGGGTGDTSTTTDTDTENQVDCSDGMMRVCDCDGELTGLRVCLDATWGECDCVMGGESSGGDSDGTGEDGFEEFPMICGTCHGDTFSPSPPVDLNRGTDPDLMTVGAHREHLTGSDWHRQVVCEDCHVVPEEIGSPGHIDEGRAELTWGEVATADGATPSFDVDSGVCAQTYCHGSTLADGGSNTEPTWNVVGEGEAACGTCHALPPGGGHPQDSNCSNCHGTVVDENLQFIDASSHVDGQVQLSFSTGGCTGCHGGDDNAAPPTDLDGNDDPTLVTVGAHQSHLGGSDWHRVISCVECHVVPTSVDDPGHMDVAPADLTWGTIASADGTSPAFDRDLAVCSNTYCHGASLDGGANVEPNWTSVGEGEAACGSCHGIPPGGAHTSSTSCETCHGSVYDGTVFVDADLHINGTVEATAYHDLSGWTTPGGGADHHGSNYFLTNRQRDEHDTNCTNCHGVNLDGGTSGVSCDNASCHGAVAWNDCSFCHGVKGVRNDPPDGVGGETITTTLAVGQHTAHETYACDTCHTVPSSGDVSHALEYVPGTDLDNPYHHGDVTFTGTPASATNWSVNATAGFPIDRRGSCVLGCHSNGRGGNPRATPYWASTGMTGDPCGNCHRASPTSNRHDTHVNGENMDCVDCHPDATNSPLHLNGTQDVNSTILGLITVTPNACQSNTLPRCSGTCHGENHGGPPGTCWN